MTRLLNQNKCRSLWPLFHGLVIVPNSFKTISCMNIISCDYESVWPEAWPQNKCRPLWPIFHGPVILCYIFKTIQCVNIILGDYGLVWLDVWFQNKCMSLWPIFHDPLILPYISRLFDGWVSHFHLMRKCDPNLDLKISIGQHDLYFMVWWFCLISSKLFNGWTS